MVLGRYLIIRYLDHAKALENGIRGSRHIDRYNYK